jgi:ABC-type molybdate transport system substrate-binding protein
MPEEPELVFAAASLSNVLGELSADWKSRGCLGETVIRRKLGAGAPDRGGRRADVFISADQEWIPPAIARTHRKFTRRNLVGNRLVLTAPADSRSNSLHRDSTGRADGGTPATGDPDTVPVAASAIGAHSLGLG